MKLRRAVASPSPPHPFLSARAPSPRQEAFGMLGKFPGWGAGGGGGEEGDGWRGAEQRELRRRVAGRSCLHRLRGGRTW